MTLGILQKKLTHANQYQILVSETQNCLHSSVVNSLLRVALFAIEGVDVIVGISGDVMLDKYVVIMSELLSILSYAVVVVTTVDVIDDANTPRVSFVAVAMETFAVQFTPEVIGVAVDKVDEIMEFEVRRTGFDFSDVVVIETVGEVSIFGMTEVVNSS